MGNRGPRQWKIGTDNDVKVREKVEFAVVPRLINEILSICRLGIVIM